MSLKRKNAKLSLCEPTSDVASKRLSGYSFSELRIPAMPVLSADYDSEVEQKLTGMSGVGSRTDSASTEMEAALENPALAVDSSNYVVRGELLCERLETVPEAAPPPPPRVGDVPKSASVQECLSRPVPSTAGVLPPPPSSITVSRQRLYRRSLSGALPHYCSLERPGRAGRSAGAAAAAAYRRPHVWMVRSQSFTDVCQPPGASEATEAPGRPPLRGGARAYDQHERSGSLRRSMRALSGSWRSLLKQVGGMSRPQKPAAAARKVAPPTVPDLTAGNRHSGGSFSSGYGSYGQPDCEPLPPPSPRDLPPSPTHHDPLGVMYAGGGCSSRLGGPAPPAHGVLPTSTTNSTAFSFPTSQPPKGAVLAQPPGPVSARDLVPHFHNHLYQHQHSDDGIDLQSPGRDSPSSAGSGSGSVAGSGCRNSTSSLDSGRASSAYESAKSSQSHPAHVNRLSGHSYESGSGSGSGSYRQSYHSSSSSLGSLERDDAISHLNVAAMLRDGMKDSEVLNAWLTDLHFEEYYHLFAAAGYDMPTVSRMTPEDLTAVGITRPAHRRKLKAEIAKLSISDGLPDCVPDSLEQWLQMLRLSEYAQLLRAQGVCTVQQATEITWEDLEEIGISRLGHQKKITLAIRRAKDILTGKRIPSQYQHQYTTQEIAIAAGGGPAEPTYQQLRTFQQPPPAQLPAAAAGSWPHHSFSQYRPLPLHQVHVQVEPGAGESPVSDEPPPPPAPQSQLQYLEQQRHLRPQPWAAVPAGGAGGGDLPPDAPPELSLVGGGGGGGGAGTLPRARPSAHAQPQTQRHRPVAKIAASTREEPPDIMSEVEPPVKRYGSLPRDPLRGGGGGGAASERVQPFSTPQATPRKPSLGGVAAGPPSGGGGGVSAERRRDSIHRAATAAQLAAARQAFPPPPLPLLVREGDTSDTSDCESSSPATVRPARADSAASFKSTSSTESDSFPFANDNAGTIKQRQVAPPQQRHLVDDAGNICPATAATHGSKATGDQPPDVLTDIGSMLADLTDELDAMLELETEPVN